jgi:CheY-like chemotaxis protein/HD-like signal output (HDOD) protein
MNQPTAFVNQVREQIGQLYLSVEGRKIVEIANNDRARVESFAEAISGDPLFASRLLRIANFAPGLTQRLSTIGQAVNALGLDNLKPLALGLAAFALEGTPPAEERFQDPYQMLALRDLWEHTLGSAAVAGRFALQLGSVSPIAAFAAGFIHDIGKVFLARQDLDRYLDALAMAREKILPSTEAETLALGMDHVQAGQEWSRQAKLAEAFDQVVCLHHRRLAMLPATIGEYSRNLIAIVQTADAVCEAEALGRGGDRGASLGELHGPLGLRPDDWSASLRAIKDEIESVRPIFGFHKRAAKKSAPAQGERLIGDQRRGAPQQKAAANGPRGVVIPFPSRAGKSFEDTKPAPDKLVILVVEDHSSLCDLLSLYFMRHGYHVRTANDGQSALEILSREEIHLVLLDLMLPRVDGFEVLRQIHRTHQEKTPYIIVVSAGASERDRKKVLELGANEYMPKPFHLLRLLERVQAVEKFLL